MHGVAVLTTSDRCAAGKMDDLSGEIAVDCLKNNGFAVVQKKIVPDDFSGIVEVLEKWSRNDSVQLIITTGGTGLSPRDVTPQATLSVIEYQVPGIPEFIRLNSVNKNEMSIISRGCAGVCNGTLIINTPGSPDGVRDSLGYLMPVLPHAISLMLGTDTDHSSIK
jgi:molybdenum cofactor synthesis domain-containing protein